LWFKASLGKNVSETSPQQDKVGVVMHVWNPIRRGIGRKITVQGPPMQKTRYTVWKII
jgi:hypothetical protein